MTWVMWRQHRAELLTLGLVVGAVGVVLLVLGLPMHALVPGGTARCAVPPLDHACRVAVTQLQRDNGYSAPILALLNLVPFAIGGFLGAPLLAREFEAGTWQLAWTQAVPRLRWLTAKLAGLAVLTVVLSAAFTGAITWYRQPLDLFGRFGIDGFDVSGAVPVAYALFAFALAAMAGALLRRSLPALAVALVGFIAVRVVVAAVLRPRFDTPVTLMQAVAAGGHDNAELDTAQDWTLGSGLADAAARPLDSLAQSMLEHKAADAGLDTPTYLHDNGIQQWVTFHPADRFWTFQLIETALFLGLSAILLTVIVWRFSRRAV